MCGVKLSDAFNIISTEGVQSGFWLSRLGSLYCKQTFPILFRLLWFPSIVARKLLCRSSCSETCTVHSQVCVCVCVHNSVCGWPLSWEIYAPLLKTRKAKRKTILDTESSNENTKRSQCPLSNLNFYSRMKQLSLAVLHTQTSKFIKFLFFNYFFLIWDCCENKRETKRKRGSVGKQPVDCALVAPTSFTLIYKLYIYTIYSNKNLYICLSTPTQHIVVDNFKRVMKDSKFQKHDW